jgi:Protein of unknown function (DUF1566)
VTKEQPSRFIKIDQHRQPLPDDASEWVAVLEPARNLMWSVAETKQLTWKKAKAAAEKLQTAGFSDWRLPTVEELFCLADRTRTSPAIDIRYFPECKSDWYWTGTLWASSPSDYAWVVYFDNGSSYYSYQYYEGFVRAVRASQ